MLVVDDNPVNLMLVQAMLEEVPGLRLVIAETPAEGLALAQTERPDLALLDIQMPGMNGFELLATLRATEGTAGMPVVAVSANALPAQIQTAREAGFVAYLTKPLEMHALVDTVCLLLGLDTPTVHEVQPD